MNHDTNGVLVPANSVPAVTDVCRPQELQAHNRRLVRHASFDVHDGHLNPSGQRTLSRYRTHAASSGKNAKNSGQSLGYSTPATGITAKSIAVIQR